MLAPGETHVHYAVDLGQVSRLHAYEALPYGIDSMWVANRTLSGPLDSALGKCMWTKASLGSVLTSSSTSYLPTLSDPILLNSIS